ncbi:uncharacterized protein LOC144442201 [Glandiceps talaboti]
MKFNRVFISLLVLLLQHHSCDADTDCPTLAEIAQQCQSTRDVIQNFLTTAGQPTATPCTMFQPCFQGPIGGLPGAKGEKGDGGENGRIGKAGPQGPKGEAGLMGSPGVKGNKGDVGPEGQKGSQGICRGPVPGIPLPDFETDWQELRSQADQESFLSISHDFREIPARVKVLVKAIDGANNGFVFEGMGSAQGDDDKASARYGGVVFSYNETEVRIWAPDKSNSGTSGCIVAAGGSLWGNLHDQCSHVAHVKVQAWRSANFPCPDVTTEWFDLKSSDGIRSFKEIQHNLGEMPTLVVVQSKAKNPAVDLAGFIYEGIGAAQSDDDRSWANHGGIVYATDPWAVRLWAPSPHDMTHPPNEYVGRIINVIDGWGGERFIQYVDDALVKVSIWKKHFPDPDYTTNWFMQMGQGQGLQPFREIQLPSIIQPDLIQVEVQAIDGPNQGFIFYGMGAQQAHTGVEYGGLVFGYSNSKIRMWSPSSDEGAIVNVIDGWGGEVNVQSSKVAMVTVKIWKSAGTGTPHTCPDMITISP